MTNNEKSQLATDIQRQYINQKVIKENKYRLQIHLGKKIIDKREAFEINSDTQSSLGLLVNPLHL